MEETRRGGVGARRKKSAADRRSQQLRSDGRAMLRMLKVPDSIAAHRGNSLGRVGLAVQHALGSSGLATMPSVPVRRDIGSPSAAEVVEVERGSPHSKSSFFTAPPSMLARKDTVSQGVDLSSGKKMEGVLAPSRYQL